MWAPKVTPKRTNGEDNLRRGSFAAVTAVWRPWWCRARGVAEEEGAKVRTAEASRRHGCSGRSSPGHMEPLPLPTSQPDGLRVAHRPSLGQICEIYFPRVI
ncbi:Dynactin Subunit 1 [Manis pentadactyla]|nr:Dynactin Subunit 1 [Manis pentadactyla]